MRLMRALFFGALAAAFVVPAGGPAPVVAQVDAWGADGGEARSREIVRRYREMLARRPVEGRIFDMLVQEVGSGLPALIEEYAELGAAEPGVFAWPMLEGHLLKVAERWDEARAAYERATGIDPESATAWQSLGEVLYRLEERAEAQQMFDRALEHAEDDEQRGDILRALADLAFDAREWDLAAERVEALVALDPDDVYTRMELAELFVRYERYEDALSHYEAIVDMAGRDTRQRAVATRDIGDVLTLMERTDEAVDAYRRAMRMVEPGYWLYRELEQRIVDAYRRDGRLDELVDDLMAEWTRPNFDQLMLLASILDEVGREDEAVDRLREAIQRDRRSIDARLALLRVLERRGEIDAVREELDALIAIVPSDASFRFRMVDLLRRSGDRDAAIEALGDIRSRFANDAGVLSEVADQYMRLRLSDEAGDTYERLVRIDPRSPDHRVALGEFHFIEGRRSEAERTWREILELVDPPADAHALLGDVFADNQLLDEAIVEYERATDLDEDSALFRRNLARLYGDARRLPQAIRLWERLLEDTTSEAFQVEARTAIVRHNDELGRLQDRIPRWREAWFDAAEPDIESAYLAGEGCMHLDDDACAEEVYLSVLEARDDDLVALLALERLYTAQHRIEDAISVVERVAEISPQRAREYYHRLAQLSLRIYDDDAAVRFARLAVELNPDDAAARARLGDIYRQMQRLEDAVAAYREAIDLDERAFPHYFELADILLAIDRVDDADELYRAVLASANDEVQVLRAGRRSLRIHQARGTLDVLVAPLEDRAWDPMVGASTLKLLVELYDAWTARLAVVADHGEPVAAARARDELDTVARRALRPVLDALSSDDPGVRDVALRVVTALRDPGAAVAVARLAESDDVRLARRAALALTRMPGVRAVGALGRLAESPDPLVADLAVLTLSTIDDPTAHALLIDVARSSRSSGRRALALVGLATAAPDDAVGRVLEQGLTDEAVVVQRAALWLAGHQPDLAPTAPLRLLIEHGRLDVPVAAAHAMARVGAADEDRLALATGLVRGVPDLRAMCGWALVRPGAPASSADDLARLAAQQLWYDRAAERVDVDRWLDLIVDHDVATTPARVSEALDGGVGTLIGEAWSGALYDRDRTQAAVLGDATSGEWLVPPAWRVPVDEVASLHEALVRALEGHVERILDIARAGDASSRAGALQVLGRIGAPSDATIAVLAEAAGSSTWSVSAAGIAGLEALEGTARDRALAALLAADDWSLRARAARALGTATTDVTEVLAAAVGDDPAESVRAEAAVALLTLDAERGAEWLDARWIALPVLVRARAAAAAVEHDGAARLVERAAADPAPLVRAAVAPR